MWQLTWKPSAGVITEEMYAYFEQKKLFPEEQKG